MGIVGVVFFVVVLTLGSFQTAQCIPGCNCTRLHPQQHYCRANYVIRGRVLLLRWELIPELHTEPSTVTEAITNPATDQTMRLNSTELMATQTSETRLAENRGMSTLPSATHQKQDDAGNFTDGLSSSPQSLVLDAMPARRQDKMLLKNRIINQEPWNYQIIYNIVTRDVFKTEEALLRKEEIELVSPYPGAGFCGVELKAGKSYIVAGFEEGRITMCDWIQEYKHVSKLQKRGLKNNYRHSCNSCQIKTCSGPECIEDLPPTTCAYIPPPDDDQLRYQPNDCTAKYQQCQPRDRGSNRCKWTTSKDSRACSRKKERGNV